MKPSPRHGRSAQPQTVRIEPAASRKPGPAMPQSQTGKRNHSRPTSHPVRREKGENRNKDQELTDQGQRNRETIPKRSRGCRRPLVPRPYVSCPCVPSPYIPCPCLYPFATPNRRFTSSQFTTFHHAAR